MLTQNCGSLKDFVKGSEDSLQFNLSQSSANKIIYLCDTHSCQLLICLTDVKVLFVKKSYARCFILFSTREMLNLDGLLIVNFWNCKKAGSS